MTDEETFDISVTFIISVLYNQTKHSFVVLTSK
jgi:hypothetical protein